MNRRDLIKGIGVAIMAGKVPTFLPHLLKPEENAVTGHCDINALSWHTSQPRKPQIGDTFLSRSDIWTYTGSTWQKLAQCSFETTQDSTILELAS